MSLLKITTTNSFEEDVLRSSIPVLIDFHAVWCGPCKASAPALEDAAREFEGEVAFVKVDIDQEPQLAETYGVQSVPTFILIQQGEPVERFSGLVSRGKLASLLEPYTGGGQ
ncbi:thioredoxin [Janthinobacterium aquaticum]|uniref:thioredoxin n=1 Tax=Janthinobacterium sp. FT58W TaxID=2654254 RepID=UPI001264D666|nr:thioredoxin [Janthinobacterium sp. FT58W]KAB8043392.1 thioredoxin [Janthinobacterium sp. FT58W]